MAEVEELPKVNLADFVNLSNVTVLQLNGKKYEGIGRGNAATGNLTARYEHDFQFSPEILAPMLIVGYPTYSEYKEGTVDLFKPSTLKGGYSYRREYRFDNGAQFKSFHHIEYSSDKGLRGNFSTNDFPCDAFGTTAWKIGSIVETFIPSLPGMIKSMMVCHWQSEDGKAKLSAIIESEYYLLHKVALPSLYWRHVTFMTEHGKSTRALKEYYQSEKITVVCQHDFGPAVNMMKELKENMVIS